MSQHQFAYKSEFGIFTIRHFLSQYNSKIAHVYVVRPHVSFVDIGDRIKR